MDKSQFDLEKFRQEFLQSDGWKVSDCYKPYEDKFLRKDAQDAYEGAKWAWQEQQKQVDELKQENQRLVLSNTGYHNASASYLCKLMNVQRILNQHIDIAKTKRADGEAFEDSTELKIADYLDDYNIALDKILSDEATQEQFNAYAKANEFLKQKARAYKNQKRIDELEKQLQQAHDDVDTFAEAYESECKFKAQFASEKDELQARVDAVEQLIQVYKDEEKELELKEWEQSTIYGRIAIELEQALKGGLNE
ncbi:hypothetical protein [Acinetobacter guerrae]|uniref:hypothetical protein n=1 Tax=Acinetobacter guerrae TaxID=1843371 RepID=UPI00125FCB68|nr:hypothetical protein [Acinetobacter guerrae]